MNLFSFSNTILKSLFSKPATRMYPFTKREDYVGTRGSIEIEIRDCIFCAICQRKCPTQAIVVNKAESKWEIDRLRCISCRECVNVCPKKCLSQNTKYSPATVNRDKDSFQNA